MTKAGHPAIISSGYYLDLLETGGDWLKFYNTDPLDFEGDEEQKALVMGGETCMWGEVVDEDNVLSRVWPRASAVAEKLWSAYTPPLNPFDFGEIFPIAARLEEQTCRLKRRGVPAQPPIGPNVCY